MASKTFLFVGLLLAIFLVMSSEIIARELAKTSPAVKLDNKNDADVDGYKRKRRCRYRCRYNRCCSYEEYVAMGKVTEVHP